MTREIVERQRELNAFTRRYLRGIAPLRVDGTWGPASGSRLARVKYWLGYNERDGKTWDSAFVRKLRHPHDPRFSPPWQLVLGANRRRRQRSLALASAQPRDGLTAYDGHQVASWMVPQLEYARHVGTGGVKWPGVVISGYRTPAYSTSLCIARCGAPSCPGTCAGASSRHSQFRKPDGAVDLSEWEAFEKAIESCPFEPRLINRLPNDRPHRSASGN